MADAGGLQLLPNTRKKISYNVPGQNRLLLLSLVFAIFMVGGYFGLQYYKDTIDGKLNDINSKLVKNEEARNKNDEEMLLRLKNSLAVIEPLLKGHILWSEALSHIQSRIHPQVQLESISANSNKNVFIFKAYASGYSAVAKQIAVFYADSAIIDITIGKISSQTDGKIEFVVQLLFDPVKLIRKP